MGLRALILRCKVTGDICNGAITTAKIKDDAVTAPKIGPDSINDKDHDHIDPAWEQAGCETGFSAGTTGFQTRDVVFPAAFPSIPNFLLASVSNTNPCQPSGLFAFVHPCNRTAAGFTMNVDINVACVLPSSYIDVCWMARRI